MKTRVWRAGGVKEFVYQKRSMFSGRIDQKSHHVWGFGVVFITQASKIESKSID